MNRHDRRKAASQARKGDDTMGQSYSFGSAPPEWLLNHPIFKEMQERVRKGLGLPPRYYDDIDEAAAAVRAWLAAQLSPPELRWLDWDKGSGFLAMGLDRGAQYLADSDDARRLLAWLDDATGGVLSLNQAGWALRLAGLMPMPEENP